MRLDLEREICHNERLDPGETWSQYVMQFLSVYDVTIFQVDISYNIENCGKTFMEKRGIYTTNHWFPFSGSLVTRVPTVIQENQ